MFTPKIIATIKTDFPSKFGVPRQSGLAKSSTAYIRFEKEYCSPDCVRGIEEFSHLWIIWYFHKADKKQFTPTVRPPKLGGNTKIGVFASRSPYRPNPIGLSLVRLLGVEKSDGKLMLKVAGADLVDGTPILDIKPYLPYAEAVENADGGFADEKAKVRLCVDFPPILLEKIDLNHRDSLKEVLSLDPRPGYQNDPTRVYGVSYNRYNIKFTVDGDKLTVIAVEL